MLDGVGALKFRCTTTGPLTLHLARASALENAGICLHPLYGFVYLPGSGLKGMARAYAETVWLPTQFEADANGQPVSPAEGQKAAAAWDQIEQVFGWAPHSDDDKPWKPRSAARHGDQDSAASGSVIFHDAWPENWPRLELDLVNCHHTDYYQGKDPPGDWESPNMVSFLAIGQGNTFLFALSKRRGTVSDDLVGLAKLWLTGALVHEGAGAKTNAGYGCFRLCDGDGPILKSRSREIFETTLELVTPAFLAGAEQKAEDCQLRGATLRGLLRWWWRTMHAGFVDVATLRALETLVWGDANTGGAVRLTVEPQGPILPLLYDYKERYSPKPDFQRIHQLQPPPNKTTQGLFYASYGVESSRGKPPRHYLEPGTRWAVRLVARPTYRQQPTGRTRAGRGEKIPAALILEQAKAAIWLLTHFGGIGSKSRKGFGCFKDIRLEGIGSFDDCRRIAQQFRQACRCDGSFRERLAESPALEQLLPPVEIVTSWKDPWFALDQLGYATQAFAQKYAHNPAKAALGLPRKIHGPLARPFPHQDKASHRPPQDLQCRKGNRYASPVFCHLAMANDASLLIRATAFPAKYLPDLNESRKILTELLDFLHTYLAQRSQELHDSGQRPGPSAQPTHPGERRPTLPQHGSLVEAVLVEDPKGKGRRFARHGPSGLVGSILHPEGVPADKQIGDAITLVVDYVSADGKQIRFRPPTSEDTTRAPRPRKGGRNDNRKGPFRGR
jgi:CRISPR-associated protein Cmr6